MSLEFFNGLSGHLDIGLTEPTEDALEGLSNQRATSTAEVVELRLVVQVWQAEEFRELTADELREPALMEAEVTLRGEGDAVTHRAPNGEWFSVGELLAAVAETERVTRHRTSWFGGIDVHHVFFEGIELGADGVWDINWGS
ncbi:hypothetical protein OHB26_25465 [Nocardia sp. NBC_01503]|uniref:hypothetical protein n=1 Tax=Nocardia sp. NBC_01503 TaxID=2975997 RepID=UPI002E7C2E1B|nr:hypothetical protein [Nocardia sp. NBC_01503]WTL30279.1 hypothetical protein OHB26_25465 [Nocardia sp. NBC_01503]